LSIFWYNCFICNVCWSHSTITETYRRLLQNQVRRVTKESNWLNLWNYHKFYDYYICLPSERVVQSLETTLHLYVIWSSCLKFFVSYRILSQPLALIENNGSEDRFFTQITYITWTQYFRWDIGEGCTRSIYKYWRKNLVESAYAQRVEEEYGWGVEEKV